MEVMRAKKRFLLPILSLVAVSSVGCSLLLYRYHSPACKQRGAALQARMVKLERDAHEKLKIGTHKDAVIRFFAENDLPLVFDGDVATGIVSVKGCAPSGCGTDDFSLRLRVKVDQEGTVTSEAIVDGIYTNCV